MKKTIVFIASALLTLATFAEQNFKPFDATVGEFFVNPLGYDLKDLSFSWKLPSERAAMKQSAYQILVANSERNLDKRPLWDSGKVESAQSIKIPYNGKPLVSREKLFWKVRVWDEKGEPSDWSDVNTFETGLLDNSEWEAKWITSAREPISLMKFPRIGNKDIQIEQKGLPPILMRKEITTRPDIKSARLYVSSLGIFEFCINGKKVGNEFWGTGWTDYNKRVQVNTYDVSKMLASGDKNTLSIELANGWYAGQNGWAHGYKQYGVVPEIIAQLEVVYENGDKSIYTTDSSWKTGFGGLQFSDIYAGEDYDATKEPVGWRENKFDDSAWEGARERPLTSSPTLDPRRAQPVRQETVLYPLTLKESGNGSYIFDFGQNMVGVVRISIPANPNRKVKIRYAEMLNKDGSLYTENYRMARSTDSYICAGYGMEEWQPKFTFHGFRYVEISGFPPNIKPSLDWVRGIVLHSDIPFIGSFVCSSQKVNKLQSCIQWGQRGNFFSVPTDCPQRDERLGWTGDAQVFAPTAAFNMDVSAFFTKWLLDVRDAQLQDGMVQSIAPALWKNGASPAWSDAAATIPWEIYMAYGDKKILRDSYDSMKCWANYIEKSSKGFISPDYGFGDWLQPNSKNGMRGETPRPLIGTAYFVRVCDIVSKTAEILGKKEESEKYSDLASEVRKAFIAKFVKPDGKVESNCQTAYLLTLAFDILPENDRQKTFAHLVKALERDKWHLNTGFVGTPLLNEVLTRFGRTDLAYRLLLNETYPSWLYPINQGGTTMWERWNSYSHKDGFGDVSMNSFNHYAYGAIGQWLYKNVAGIWYDDDAPGYKNIIFAPKLGGDLTFASATHQTPYGTASSGWRISDGVMEWSIVIPANSTGTFTFPTKNTASIRINGHRVAQDSFTDVDGYPTLENMQSGKYQILLRLK